VGLSPLYCGQFWPIVPAPDDRWGWLWSNWWNEVWQGKPKYSEKACPSPTLSTTNPTWPDPGSNPGLRDGKPATNRLSYGAASQVRQSSIVFQFVHLLISSPSWKFIQCTRRVELAKIVQHCIQSPCGYSFTHFNNEAGCIIRMMKSRKMRWAGM
jgi:hypothetical protein